jgi:UDPglucose 6-dehydrogenase
VAELLPDVQLFDDPLAACRGAHAAVIATEWPEIAGIDPAALRDALDYPIVIDGRNALDARAALAAGLRYHGIGRGNLGN